MSEPFISRLPGVEQLIALALEEDLGRGDATTEAIFGKEDPHGSAVMVARQKLWVAGLAVADAVFRAVDPDIAVVWRAQDGDCAAEGSPLLALDGSLRSILAAERTALNFVQRLAGIATQSARFAARVAGTQARVVDTRKTAPGYRVLDKAAVRAGGCWNHRADLAGGILIKDNHIAAAGSVSEAVTRARRSAPHPLRVEAEVRNMEEVQAALVAGAELLLLDNMSVSEVREAVRVAHQNGVQVEVSGGVDLDSVRGFAEAGADFISVGALTHSAPAADVALELCQQGGAA